MYTEEEIDFRSGGNFYSRFKNNISSIKVEEPNKKYIELYKGNILYSRLPIGNYSTNIQMGIDNDSISKIINPSGLQFTVYNKGNYNPSEGVCVYIERHIDFRWGRNFYSRFKNNISSIKVEEPNKKYIELYKGDTLYSRLPIGNYSTNIQMGIDNDSISKIKNPSGLQFTVYNHGNYNASAGVCVYIERHIDFRWERNFYSRFKNNISSIKVEEPNKKYIELYKDTNGTIQSRLPIGNYSTNTQMGIDNDSITKIKNPSGLKIRVYNNEDYDKSAGFREFDNKNELDFTIQYKSINDIISSIKVME